MSVAGRLGESAEEARIKMKTEKLKIGDTVYKRGDDKDVDELTVDKVGHLYFYIKLSRWRSDKFRLDTLTEVCDCGRRIQLYRTSGEIQVEIDRDRAHNKGRQVFSGYTANSSGLTDSQLARIETILDEEKPK